MRLLGLLGIFLLPACGGTLSSISGTEGDGGKAPPNDAASGRDASSSFDASSIDVQAESDASSTCGVNRVPQNHRPAGEMCPSERGSGITTTGDPDGGIPGTCSQDSDCTMGDNGRCLPRDFGAQVALCSYDQCYDDAECKGNAPCICRPSTTSTEPNFCGSGSNCRVDADCGPCGFCSPSQGKGAFCGEADPVYFCHTLADTCVDDSDCHEGSCNYDPKLAAWSCAPECAPPPP